MPKVWFITGSSRGLGRQIVEAALKAGDTVVATARTPQSLADLAGCYGSRIVTVALEVTNVQAANAAVQTAIETFGRIDVLVNNAGYAHLAPFEQMDAEDFRAQMDTNFYGVVNVTRAVVPFMRQMRSGRIIQISSIGARIGTPGFSAYQAAKWAVSGFTEVLHHELRPSGIKVTAVEPGGIRTQFAANATNANAVPLPEYEETVGTLQNLLRNCAGREPGDPLRMANVIVNLTRHDNPPLRLLLGSDAVLLAEHADAYRQAQDEAWREVSTATDMLPPFPDSARLAEQEYALGQAQDQALRSIVER